MKKTILAVIIILTLNIAQAEKMLISKSILTVNADHAPLIAAFPHNKATRFRIVKQPTLGNIRINKNQTFSYFPDKKLIDGLIFKDAQPIEFIYQAQYADGKTTLPTKVKILVYDQIKPQNIAQYFPQTNTSKAVAKTYKTTPQKRLITEVPTSEKSIDETAASTVE